MTSYIYIPVSEIAKPTFEFGHIPEDVGGLRRYPTDLHWMYEKIGCEYVEGVMLGHNQVMYVDDVGRGNQPFNPLASVVFHRFRGGDMICGNALLMAYDNEGENANVSPDMLLSVAKMATAMMTEGTLNELA